MKYSSSQPEEYVCEDDYDGNSNADADYQQSLPQNTSQNRFQNTKYARSNGQRHCDGCGKQVATAPPTRMFTSFFAAASAAAAASAGAAGGSMTFSDTIPRATKNVLELLDANAAFKFCL